MTPHLSDLYRSPGRMQKGTRYTFANEYGRVTLEAIEDPVSLGAIQEVNYPDEIKFDMDTCERLVLITGNRRSQVSTRFPLSPNPMFIFTLHYGPRVCAVCKIHSMDFVPGVNAREELAARAF